MKTLVRGWKPMRLGLAALGIALIPGVAKAQSIGPTGEVMASPAAAQGSAVGNSRTSGNLPFSPNSGLNGMAGNPFANPYLNPYLNPLMTNQTTTPQNAALYFLAAQQSAGGLGSGRLSGSRGGSGKVAAAAGPPSRGGSNVPGSGASQFFNRSLPRNGGASHYYGRQGKHFPGNSR